MLLRRAGVPWQTDSLHASRYAAARRSTMAPAPEGGHTSEECFSELSWTENQFRQEKDEYLVLQIGC